MGLKDSVGHQLASHPVLLFGDRPGAAESELSATALGHPDAVVVVAPGLTEQTALRARLSKQSDTGGSVRFALLALTGLGTADQGLESAFAVARMGFASRLRRRQPETKARDTAHHHYSHLLLLPFARP